MSVLNGQNKAVILLASPKANYPLISFNAVPVLTLTYVVHLITQRLGDLITRIIHLYDSIEPFWKWPIKGYNQLTAAAISSNCLAMAEVILGFNPPDVFHCAGRSELTSLSSVACVTKVS